METSSSASSANDRNALALAGLRIGVGVFFRLFGEYKVFGTKFRLGGGLQWWISRFLEGSAYPFMAPVLKNFVLPHGTAIAFLVAYGELAIGLALVLGVLARVASAFRLLFMLTLLFASHYPGPHAALRQYFGASLSHSLFSCCLTAVLPWSVHQALAVPVLRFR